LINARVFFANGNNWLFWLICALLLAFYVGISYGTITVPWREIWAIICGDGGGSLHEVIIMKIRLPRVIFAALVGASLSVSGAAFQAVLRNPLADPYILGVSGGAALGSVLAITLGGYSLLVLPLSAFCGALIALVAVYMVARSSRGDSHTLILAGVMVGSLAAALLLFFLWLAPSDSVRNAVFWLAGNLSNVRIDWLPWGYLVSVLAFLVLWRQSRVLDLFTQGEDCAADLGLDVPRARLLIFAVAGVLVAMAVSMAGLVGFVGLVIPHVVRLLWGPGHARLLPAAALAGAAFMVFADALSRVVLAPAELPVGVVTALIGAPFFLYLLRLRGER